MRSKPSLVPLILVAVLVAVLVGGANADGDTWTGSKDWKPPELVAEDVRKARSLIEQGRIAEAETVSLAMLARAENDAGVESVESMCALNLLVDAMVRNGKGATEDARRHVDRAMRISVTRFGAEHPLTAWSMQLDAWVSEVQGDAERARDILERALAIVLSAVPREHADVMTIRNSLSNLLRRMSRFDEAMGHARLVVDAARASEGPDSPVYATVLNNLAVLEEQMGNYDAALEHQMEVLALRERVLEPDHPDFGQSWTNIAIIHSYAGRPHHALEYFQKTVAQGERVWGPQHPEVASALNNAANAVWELGDLLEAREMHERAREIRTVAFGPDHAEVSQSLFNIAELDRDLGDLDGAERGFDAAFAIRNRVYGPHHYRTAQCLVGMGCALRESGRADEALPKLRAGAQGYLENFGDTHPEVASAFSHEARAHLELGRLDEADSLVQRAFAIRTAALSPEHPVLASSHDDRGDIAMARGDAAAALVECDEALRVRRVHLDGTHPLLAGSLRRRANALAALGRSGDAFACALDAETGAREHVKLVARGLSERQAITYSGERASGLALAARLAASAPDAAPAHATWDAVIRGRALVLDELAKRRRAVARASTPEVAAAVADLASTRRRLANVTLRGPGDDPAAYRARLGEMRTEKERAEEALARVSERFREERDAEDGGLAAVIDALGPDEALVAFLRAERESAAEYVAFVRPAGGREPIALALADADVVDRAVESWHASLGAPDDPRGISRSKGRDTEPETRARGDEVRRLLWDPVAKHLGDARIAFLVPDGAVHFVSFDALPQDAAGYVVEGAPLLHYLSAERDLLREPEAAPPNRILAIGGLDFDADPKRAPKGEPPTELAALRGDTGDCDALGSLHFLPLSSARAEVEDVARSGRQAGCVVETWTGTDAPESRVKEGAGGHRIIHFATHGFFLSDCASPLVSSGLALTGANRHAEADDLGDDGILTAEEIASLDLAGVEWAVLSACDTGLGEIHAAEGILGLRRAFEVAGARTLISSLWRVDDATAAEWMRILYGARFERGRSTAEAVREANLALLAAARANGGTPHPRAWGGFVAAGDWR